MTHTDSTNRGIRIIQLSDQTMSNLTNLLNVLWLKWSPNGKVILAKAFPGGDPTQIELWTIDVSAEPTINNFTSGEFTGLEAAWSPDSSEIVFSGYSSDAIDLWIINSSTLERHMLTEGFELAASSPRWSTSGEEIAFIAFDISKFQNSIWIVDIQTLKFTPLVEN